jgi:hypothetical protein
MGGKSEATSSSGEIETSKKSCILGTDLGEAEIQLGKHPARIDSDSSPIRTLRSRVHALSLISLVAPRLAQKIPLVRTLGHILQLSTKYRLK